MVVVVGAGGRVTVNASEIEARLSDFTWMYKQKGGPHLKDSGKADATMGGCVCHRI